MEGEAGQEENHIDNQKEILNRRISFWLSFILAIVITWWYCALNPPDSTEMRKMRLFFKENIMNVAKFVRLPNDELQELYPVITLPISIGLTLYFCGRSHLLLSGFWG